jgi:hypothetical protein
MAIPMAWTALGCHCSIASYEAVAKLFQTRRGLRILANESALGPLCQTAIIEALPLLNGQRTLSIYYESSVLETLYRSEAVLEAAY